MKTYSVLLIASLLAFGSLEVRAEVYDLTTNHGKTYRQCRVLKIELDGVSFHHSNGMAKVLFKDLTPQWRQHFGYDAEKANAHELKIKQDRAKAYEAAMKQAQEAAIAQQAAMNAQIERETLLALQSLAFQGGGCCGNYNGFIGMTGGVPSDFYNGQWQPNFRHNGNGVCNANNGFTRVPFFAVPGIGPNVNPAPPVMARPRISVKSVPASSVRR